MLEKLKKLNPDIDLYSVDDDEFKKYGRVLDIDTEEITAASNKISLPESGSRYLMSVEALENTACSDKLRELIFGGCESQIGLCFGYNSMMNGLEFHKSSEINIAVTPFVLLLGLEYEMQGNEYQSNKIKGFFVERGKAIEVYSTSLHFCPCQVSGKGFSCVVGLPKGTNDSLSFKSDDELLFKKNKWLICHDKNDDLINKGVYPGIHGENYTIKYQ